MYTTGLMVPPIFLITIVTFEDDRTVKADDIRALAGGRDT